MKTGIIIPLILLAVTAAPVISSAIPRPCSEGELLESSDYAVRGTVTKVECGEAHDSGECRPRGGEAGFKPEMVAKCTAMVSVTKSIKGNYAPGSEAPVPFLKVVSKCENGSHIIPGSPKADLSVNMPVVYYNSDACRYSNLEILPSPTPGPDSE
ncbi:MAG TPA: hypothetical protein PKC29_06780 [Thermodesulfobacteriota bacterium]|nr:hypothetical protein [Thermodesulfobacteriota bacterium]